MSRSFRFPRRGRWRARLALAWACLAVAPGCASLGWAPPPPPTLDEDGLFVAPSRDAAPVVRARGRVFHDVDGNGVRGAGEPGLSGVRVSNGVDIVRTDDEGRYAIDLQGDGAVFVIKPRDWRTPLDRHGLPQFYRLHRPNGSADEGFEFPGSEPTGPLPESVDFALTPHPEPERFRIVAIGDPQPYDASHLAWYGRDTVAELVGVDAELVLLLGDLVGNDLSLFEPLNELNGLIGPPIYPVPGNHDVNARAPDDALSLETYERVYGPSTYAFQVGRVHFAVLDDVVWGGAAPADWMGRGHYVGGLRPDQLRFLENLLATLPQDDLLVLAMHIPLDSQSGGAPTPNRAVFELLSAHPRSLSISGHTHSIRHRFFGADHGYAPEGGGEHHHFTAGAASGNRYRGVRDEVGIPHATMRDGSPNGYAFIEFDGADYRIRYKASRRPASYQMNVIAPDRVEPGRAALVEVNVFNGNERSRVEMRVGSAGEWQALRRRTGTDPLYEAARARERTPGALALQESRSTRHLWVGRLPRDLAPGTHLIEIRATDMWGRVDRAHRPVRVGPPDD
ncbi:MAG: calcineurin-like phosphoesterase C-terminal domain-containing protein [Myxococcota bacterium]